MKSIYYIILVILLQSCMKEQIVFNSKPDINLDLALILSFNNKDCAFDAKTNTLRYSIDKKGLSNFSPIVDFQNFSEVYFEGKQLKNHIKNNLGTIELKKNYKIVVKGENFEQNLILSFTNLAIVQINTLDKIINEPKILARIIVKHPSDNQEMTNSYIGIEHRGASSQQYDKKSMGFSFLNSQSLNDKEPKSIFNLESKTNWILDAMFIDKSRLRNNVSFKIWNQFEGENHHAINSNLVELYINNELQGLYSLNEKIDEELLNLDVSDLLYKAVSEGEGATLFGKYNEKVSQNYFWDGWEQKFPNPNNQLNWEPLKQLRKTIVTTNDIDFKTNVSSKIDIDNLIDYYIFLNLTNSFDNTGKNTYLMKNQTNQKFILIPWDLDGSFGIYWDGSSIGYDNILSNNLYKRLFETNPNNFKNRLKSRWTQLRTLNLSDESLTLIFEENFNLITQSNIIEIENNKWNLNINTQNEQHYLLAWIQNRTNFLDEYFNNL